MNSLVTTLNVRLLLFWNSFITYVFQFLGENSDVTIILNGGTKRIPGHTLVFFARCKKICLDIVEANGSKYLEAWSHLSCNVVMSFLTYLYCGILDLELNSIDEIQSAKHLRDSYPDLNIWKSYGNDDDQSQ